MADTGIAARSLPWNPFQDSVKIESVRGFIEIRAGIGVSERGADD